MSGRRDSKNSFPLRLPASLQEETRKAAEQEGVSLNQLFSLAIAERISVLRTEGFFRARSKAANIARARAILRQAGNEAVREGDEVMPAQKKERRSKR